MLLLGSVVSPLGASVVSPLLDTLTGVYGVGEARIGLMMAVFTAPSIVLIPLVGVLSDRYGRKPLLLAGLALFGAAGVALVGTTDFRVVLALRLLQGIGYTGIVPVLIAAVGDLYAGGREATAQGLRFTAVGVSLTVFPLIAGIVVGLAWQYPFYLFALGLPATVAVALLFEEPTRRSARTEADGGDGGGTFRDLAALVRTPAVAAAVVGRTIPSFLWFCFLTYNSIVVVRLLDGTSGQAGMLVAIASVASSLGATQVGRLTAAFETRRNPLLGGTLACAVGLALLGTAPSLPVAGVGSVCIGAGFGVVLSLYRSLATALAPEALRGSLVSVAESIGRIGSTTAPLVVGALVALSRPTLGFVDAVRYTLVGVAAVAILAGGVCAFVVDTNGPQEAAV
ncbi:MFS transporter [Haloplanus sp. GCM10025708]|uniref:MFS transporter n=1 Tax=Haloplanus sp. GCM10025708 TaxID=3252679 RepID=UPI00360BB53F